MQWVERDEKKDRADREREANKVQRLEGRGGGVFWRYYQKASTKKSGRTSG